MTTYPRITQTAKYLPEKCVTNQDLPSWLETSDEWILSRTGIGQRFIAETENTHELCTKVAQKLLKKANLSPLELDFIIVATMTGDFGMPSTACLVQGEIKATQAMCFDINSACSGFVYGLSLGEKLIQSGSYQKGLVIGGEVMSKLLDWQDRRTSVLFGDGAAGVLLEAVAGKPQFLAEKLGSDGSRGQALQARPFLINNPWVKQEERLSPYLTMDGRQVFQFTLNTVTENISTILKDNHLLPTDLDACLLHQANLRIVEGISHKTEIPLAKLPVNMERYGNTSAASIPILLDDCVEQGILKLGSEQKVLLTGFGGGLTWGSILLSL